MVASLCAGKGPAEPGDGPGLKGAVSTGLTDGDPGDVAGSSANDAPAGPNWALPNSYGVTA